MAKGFAIHNAPTSHGGIVPSTQVSNSQQGNLFVRAGDGHFCPQCKCWSTVIKSHDHVIMDGKPVAYAGDKLTCGATIQPQQSHVVGNSGGGILKTMASNFQSTTNQPQNNNFMDDAIKKNEIILKDLILKEFVPLGIPKSDGSPSNGIFIFQGATVNAIFEAITLEVKKDGKFIEVKRINQAFLGSKKFKIEWDGFIQDIYDSKFMTGANGVIFRVQGINGGNAIALDEKTFNFKYFNKDWMDILINRKKLKVDITLRVNFIDGGAVGLFNGNSIPKNKIVIHKSNPYAIQTKTFSQLQQLACDGINYYWSRNNTHPTGKNISVKNDKYEIFVKAKQSLSNAMPNMKLTFVTNVDPNDPLFRSSNWMLSRKTAYMTGYLKFDSGWSFYSYDYSDKKFRETIAHETGHAIVETYSGFIDSITHHGSSKLNQNPKSGTTYPRSGEIDLMKYADEHLSSISTWDARMIANSKDVTGLLFISGICKK